MKKQEKKTQKYLENLEKSKNERKTSLTIKKTTEQEHIIIDIKDLEIIRELGQDRSELYVWRNINK